MNESEARVAAAQLSVETARAEAETARLRYAVPAVEATSRSRLLTKRTYAHCAFAVSAMFGICLAPAAAWPLAAVVVVASVAFIVVEIRG